MRPQIIRATRPRVATLLHPTRHADGPIGLCDMREGPTCVARRRVGGVRIADLCLSLRGYPRAREVSDLHTAGTTTAAGGAALWRRAMPARVVGGASHGRPARGAGDHSRDGARVSGAGGGRAGADRRSRPELCIVGDTEESGPRDAFAGASPPRIRSAPAEKARGCPTAVVSGGRALAGRCRTAGGGAAHAAASSRTGDFGSRMWRLSRQLLPRRW